MVKALLAALFLQSQARSPVTVMARAALYPFAEMARALSSAEQEATFSLL